MDEPLPDIAPAEADQEKVGFAIGAPPIASEAAEKVVVPPVAREAVVGEIVTLSKLSQVSSRVK